MALTTILILSCLGLLISLYAFYVKKKMEKDKNYSPVCDLSDKVSCTKAMGSEYGSFFIVPNSVWGIGFYALVLLLSILGNIEAVIWLSIVAVLGSIYLAYISFFKIKVLCPLCLGIYAINILILIFSYSAI